MLLVRLVDLLLILVMKLQVFFIYLFIYNNFVKDIVPVNDGKVIKDAVIRSFIAGNDLTKYLQ